MAFQTNQAYRYINSIELSLFFEGEDDIPQSLVEQDAMGLASRASLRNIRRNGKPKPKKVHHLA